MEPLGNAGCAVHEPVTALDQQLAKAQGKQQYRDEHSKNNSLAFDGIFYGGIRGAVQQLGILQQGFTRATVPE